MLAFLQQLPDRVVGEGHGAQGIAGLGQASQRVVAIAGVGALVLALVRLGCQTPEHVALEARHLAGAEVRTAGLDQVRQFARQVVAIALVSPVEADLVGQSVHDVVAEGGVFAVL